MTACETGKPGYQDGEGMISLAHAFNYAGSRSILTGLWKIYKQASAMLLEYFYTNLENGMPKDEALQMAKLSYLQHAKGRMLQPQYWAGFIIMGDTRPVKFVKDNTRRWQVIAGAGLIHLIFFVYYKRRQARAA